MMELKLDPKNLGTGEDWVGDAAAFTCPHCGKVFIVVGHLHLSGRRCPSCGQSRGQVLGAPIGGGIAILKY